MSTLVCLLEERSAEAMLRGILPHLIPEDCEAVFIPFEGKQDLEKQWEEERIKREKEKKEREESERALRKQEEQAYRRKARWEFLKAFATRVTALAARFIAVLIAIGIVLLIGALLVGFGGFLLDMLVNIIAAILTVATWAGGAPPRPTLGARAIFILFVLWLFGQGCG